MKKINFKNLPDTSTPLSAENMNLLQNNVEESTVEVGITEPKNNQAVWFKSSKNKFDKNHYGYSSKYIEFNLKNAKKGETYTITTNKPLDGIKFSDGPNQASGAEGPQTFATFTKWTFTINNYTTFYLRANKVWLTDINTIKDFNIQIEKGNVATPFEKYVEDEIYTKNNDEYNKFNTNNYFILFKGEQGDMNTEILLNDNVKNYSRIIVEGHNGDNWFDSVTLDDANGKKSVLNCSIINPDGNYSQFLGFQVAENKIKIQYNYDAVNRAGQYERYGENRWKITKVIGIK